MNSIQDIKDESERQVKAIMDDYSLSESWKRSKLIELMSDALDLAYRQGRDDQDYKDKGPRKIDLYRK